MTMHRKKNKIGVVGIGHLGNYQVQNCQLENCDIVASPTPEENQEAADIIIAPLSDHRNLTAVTRKHCPYLRRALPCR